MLSRFKFFIPSRLELRKAQRRRVRNLQLLATRRRQLVTDFGDNA